VLHMAVEEPTIGGAGKQRWSSVYYYQCLIWIRPETWLHAKTLLGLDVM